MDYAKAGGAEMTRNLAGGLDDALEIGKVQRLYPFICKYHL